MGEDKGAKPEAEVQSEPMSEAQEGSFGTWMLVTRKKKVKGQQEKEGARFASFKSTRESSPTRSPGFLPTSPNQKENDSAIRDKPVGQSMMGGSLPSNALFADRTHYLSSMEMARDEQSTLRGSIGSKNQKARVQHAKPRISTKSNVVDKGNPTPEVDSYQRKGGRRCQGVWDGNRGV